MPEIREPDIVLFMGRPDTEEPHRSVESCSKFLDEHPKIRLGIIVWEKQDLEDLQKKLPPHERLDWFLWEDDSKLMNQLMDGLAKWTGAQVVGPRWYVCEAGHTLSGSSDRKLKTSCDFGACREPLTIVLKYEDRIQRFAEIFADVIHLANFDTGSGEILHAMVNPTKNIMYNMPFAVGCSHDPAPVTPATLRGSWSGKPALLVSAGPSLDDAMPHLKRLYDAGGTQILCVGRVFRKLHAAGIIPDYTFSCEMFDWDSAIFDGVTPEMASKTRLAFASMCAPATVRKWPGPKVCLFDPESARLLGRDDHILGGNSVSHHLLNFAAQILGADPVVLVGQDLAYTKPENQSHATGSVPETWPEEIKKIDHALHEVTLWLPCTGKGATFYPECHRTLAAVGGGGFMPTRQIEVLSSISYKHFATLFAMLIQKHGKKVLNACGNGLKIAGTEYVDLSTWTP